MKVFPYGERALLAEPEDPRTVPGLRAALLADERIVEAVPGARTLLVVFDPGRTDAAQVEALLAATHPHAAEPDAASAVELPVRYDGLDLASVAARVGLSPDDVVRLHAGATYTVRFCGFAPGFAYLDGLDPRLHVPRRDEPRARVPAGSVGVAGEFTGAYPRASPGGWQLLGRTDARLWDAARVPPALLSPGTTVRFRPQ